MPLDAKTNDLVAIKNAAGCTATFVQKKRGASALIAGEPLMADAAAQTTRLWQAFAQIPDADVMLWRRSDGFSTAFRSGGMVLEGRKPFNIGLARKQVAGLAPFDPQPRKIAAPKTNLMRRATWALSERLGRVEAPRLLEIMVGESEYVILAEKSGFGLVEDENGVDGLTTAVERATAAKHNIEFTYGDGLEAKPSSRHTISELFAISEANDVWSFDTVAWPTAVPRDASFDAILTMRAFAACIASVDASPSQIDILDDTGRPVLRATVDADGVLFKADLASVSERSCAEFGAWALKF